MKNLRDPGDSPRKVPTHEIAYWRLRDMILFGQIPPGRPVTIQGLTATLDAGMTPPPHSRTTHDEFPIDE